MTFETIKKSSAPEMVAEQIIRKITAGELAPGTRLPAQRDLAQMLGVGRSSVREAINALVVMGYLEPQQGRGTFIKQTLPHDDAGMQKLAAAFGASSIFDLMEAREMLECRSAALAAERSDGEQIRRLKRVMEAVEATENDYSIFLDADLRFHAAVADAAGNTVLCELTKLVLEKVVAHHATLKTALLPPAYREVSIRTAARVVAAIEAGDADGAARWMARHLDAIRDELKNIIR
ncbi:GntR family transcriptional regulator [Desulfosarcina ovata subsp. sediminis]|uniref:GntR family transcriptional regulator n=1 Tax=Desulfosarcina ovata subsp. sediminis TaxID=885957 RepID=A0A5K7ZWV0_9BACT|nr:FadR/GntR family transcriptional regulator [Desulfosarcina ovata]BBO84654.1 GntR family transcriptional regulator [Desulfosarcina ovata subsp. sediminis]